MPAASQSWLASTSAHDRMTGPRSIASPAIGSSLRVHDAGLVFPLPAGHELVGIHDHVLPAVVVHEVEVQHEHARLQRDDDALARRDAMAARADDALGVEEQHDLFAQARELGVACRSRGTAATRASRATAPPEWPAFAGSAAGASAEVRSEHGAAALLGVAGSPRRRHRTASACRAVAAPRAPEASRRRAAARDDRAAAPPRLVERAACLVAASPCALAMCIAELLRTRVLTIAPARATPRCCAARSPACESRAAGC